MRRRGALGAGCGGGRNSGRAAGFRSLDGVCGCEARAGCPRGEVPLGALDEVCKQGV